MIARFSRLLRTRLALRSAAITLLAVGLLGLISVFAAMLVSEQRERQKEYERIDQLLDTVEQTAQIACFLSNRELGEEVVHGLLNNRIVNHVSIRAGGEVLVEARQPDVPLSRLAPVERLVRSPFDSSEEVCSIVLLPDDEEIRSAAIQASSFISLLLSLQLLAIAVVVAFVIVAFVTRPIRQVSYRLHRLEAQTGEKLQAPKGNEQDEIGSLVASVNAMIDRLVDAIAEERRLRLEREVEERRFRTIFENVETGIFELDEQGLVASANPAFRRMFALPEQGASAGESLRLRDLVEHPEQLEEALQALTVNSPPAYLELPLVVDKQRRWVAVLLNRIEQGRVQCVANDITESRRAVDAVEQMAMTDSLTGLGNRRGLEWRLNAAARVYASDPGYRAALILLDLDHFKEANDTFGHTVGDKVLQHVGRLLTDLVRKADYVARLGGDEFVVLLDGVAARDEIEAIVQRFLRQVNEPIPVEDGQVRVGASLGIAIFGEDGGGEQAVIQLADAAMYEAKRAGRNTFRFHET